MVFIILLLFYSRLPSQLFQKQGKGKKIAAKREQGPAPDPSDSKVAVGVEVATRKTTPRTVLNKIKVRSLERKMRKKPKQSSTDCVLWQD